ncbi:MAG: AIM24 family protein [Bryobacterales bacterium]|nr:AIM24 family protein [Bryobacterales bacterium]
MFCTDCGAPALDDQNFCRNCGHPLKRTHPPAPAPPPPANRNRCNWCGTEVDSSQLSCPRCGATLRQKVVADESGWIQLPARKDMTRLQVGNSTCQIEGLYVPVADMNLAAGDSVYFTHHVLLWKDPQVNITAMSLAGAWKRVFAGLPLIMTQAEGPGHIAFSKDAPGELIPVALQPGQSIDVREHMLLTATSNAAYDWFQTGIWFDTKDGDETETHYPLGRFMDRFTSPASPGLVLLHAAGNVFVRSLAPGETILIKPTALVFKDPGVRMHLHFEQPGSIFTSWRYWSNRYLWLRLFGPGRVAIQSVFDRVEGEERNMTRWSNATTTRW